jgi:hypothetical protein
MSLSDLTGQTFGRLTVLGESPVRTKDNRKQCECQCSCGKLTTVRVAELRRGRSRSCGCLVRERVSAANTKHGFAHQCGNAHYTRWCSIKQRTGNPNDQEYRNYGGRGIKLHEPWVKDFMKFKSWLDENLGPCPDGCSIDRIDNDGNYEPGNLRWASAKHQRRNQR